jgi:hypothetical protein
MVEMNGNRIYGEIMILMDMNFRICEFGGGRGRWEVEDGKKKKKGLRR